MLVPAAVSSLVLAYAFGVALGDVADLVTVAGILRLATDRQSSVAGVVLLGLTIEELVPRGSDSRFSVSDRIRRFRAVSSYEDLGCGSRIDMIVESCSELLGMKKANDLLVS